MYKKNYLLSFFRGYGECYGGLKQVDAFTSEGDTIIDFSMYDALQAGFGNFK